MASCTCVYTCYPQSMTSKKTAAVQPAEAEAPLGMPVQEVLPLSRVAFRHQDDALQTNAVTIGERMTSGWYVGAAIEAIFATPLGIVVELKYPDGREVAILHTGDTTGALV